MAGLQLDARLVQGRLQLLFKEIATPVITVSGEQSSWERDKSNVIVRRFSKVVALNQGADNYLTTPIGTAELLARIQVALRS